MFVVAPPPHPRQRRQSLDSGKGFKITFFHDITQLKEAEDRAFELAIEREQARILADFIESASHEFHTPLSIIETSVYLLKRGLAPEHHRRLEVIRTQG